MDFVEKNAIVFAELFQYLDDKSLSLVMRDAKDIKNIKGTIFIKNRLIGLVARVFANGPGALGSILGRLKKNGT